MFSVLKCWKIDVSDTVNPMNKNLKFSMLALLGS